MAGRGSTGPTLGRSCRTSATPTEACINPDPTRVDGKLNDFDFFAPNPTPGNINGKDNLCQAFIAWEPVNVTASGVTTVHYVLYGGWRRNAIPGDMSFFVPLFGGTSSKSDITLVQFDFDPSSGTNVVLRNWNGIAWAAGDPASGRVPGVRPNRATLRRSASSRSTSPRRAFCRRRAPADPFVSSYVVTKPGEGNADLEDYVAVPPVQISNCSSIRITKATTPAVPDTPATFSYTLDRVDGGPVQDNTPLRRAEH